jgi:hypothetical protein
MADDVYFGITHDSQHTLCILFFITILPTNAMDAGDGNVQTVEILVI